MSSDIKRIDTEKLDEISRQFNRLSGSLDSVSTSIGAILSTARSVVPEQPDFIRNINTLKNRVNSAGDYAHELSNAVSNASAQWAEAERQLANKPLGPGEDPNSTGDSTGESAGSSGKSAWDYILEGLFKTIGGTGAVGKIELLLGASVGAALLAEVVGEDAKYCKNPQYRIDCGDDNVWRVFPAVEATANATVVNGVEVAEGGIPLKSGDVIAVASRNDLSKTAAAVAVELVLL